MADCPSDCEILKMKVECCPPYVLSKSLAQEAEWKTERE